MCLVSGRAPSGKFDEMAAALKAESDNRRKAEASLERLKAASRAEIVRLRAVVEDLKVKLEVRPETNTRSCCCCATLWYGKR